jgi:hypothetical protein
MPTPPRRKLRKREVAFAVALGGLAAGTAALILGGSDDSSPAPISVAAAPQTFELAEFDEISTSGPQQVVVTLGETQSVRSEGSPEALGQLEVVVEDGELIIRPRDESGVDWGVLSSAKYFVTVPHLEAVSLAGSGNLRVDRIEGDSFTGTIGGSGELTIADMEVDEADFRIGGSGTVIAAGTAGETRVAIGGSGDVQARELRSDEASVDIGGSGNVALTVEDEARVLIAGSGDVDISGPARCSVTNIGGGNVRCGSDSD